MRFCSNSANGKWSVLSRRFQQAGNSLPSVHTYREAIILYPIERFLPTLSEGWSTLVPLDSLIQIMRYITRCFAYCHKRGANKAFSWVGRALQALSEKVITNWIECVPTKPSTGTEGSLGPFWKCDYKSSYTECQRCLRLGQSGPSCPSLKKHYKLSQTGCQQLFYCFTVWLIFFWTQNPVQKENLAIKCLYY